MSAYAAILTSSLGLRILSVKEMFLEKLIFEQSTKG